MDIAIPTPLSAATALFDDVQDPTTMQSACMTPQILVNALRHSFIKLQTIKILIFDECHHARVIVHVDILYSLFTNIASDLKTLQEKFECDIEKANIEESQKENARQRLSNLCSTFFFCLRNLDFGWP
ncbi:hypothetical protein POM88_001119 [Heracleum sosnowskyi]|uniref:Uncharacterized protein n=1 Tax=Heracleum sosnowskyi TaxID=360622 RepID=A0AAD8JCD2_9APIA|nr:hypothetical protein POM88_001119 [Heracleum sosnowskyi]